jgi:type VI secretion system protein ImpI
MCAFVDGHFDVNMTLRLLIENVDRLPDGGPLRYEANGRGLDLGRDMHLDWTLPDPSRSISSKHCEIRFRNGEYWLHDVSRNGTFVNGAQYRLDAPYKLRDGDRLSIGPYIVAVSVEGQPAEPHGGDIAAPTDVWGPVGEPAAPENRSGFQRGKQQEFAPDFLDFAALVDPPLASVGSGSISERSDERSPGADDWMSGQATTRESPPAARDLPQPRRRQVSPLPEPEGANSAAESAVLATATAGPQAADFLTRIARAAGVPERLFAERDPNMLADQIGAAMRLTAENLAQMLSSRAESKTLMRSSSRTVVKSTENNPLKFSGSTEEALTLMFGPPTRRYLDAQATIERSFADLKAHEILTYGAMQGALDALFEDLAPDRIDHSVESDKGLSGLVSSRKARLWDAYVERWRAKTKRSDGRLLEAFTALFAEAYDRLQSGK